LKAWRRNSSNLNRFNTPQNATIFTIVPTWLIFLMGFAPMNWDSGEKRDFRSTQICSVFPASAERLLVCNLLVSGHPPEKAEAERI
jgi:hypothetical protein